MVQNGREPSIIRAKKESGKIYPKDFLNMLEENNNLNKENFSPKKEGITNYDNFKESMPEVFGRQSSKNLLKK